jgi:hypothetical protein
MSLNVGVAFVGTGGYKMVRALRSFRRAEPDLPVHVVFDTSTNSWQRNVQMVRAEWFAAQPNVKVRCITNDAYVNGAFNAGIRWLADLGYPIVCMFHDDVVFSPLPENRGHVTEWFGRLDTDPELQQSSGLTLASMEALVPSPIVGHWQRSPAEWDVLDLESEHLWRTMLPGGKSPMYYGSPGSDDGVKLDGWFVKYFYPDKTCPLSRLGPTGFVIPVHVYEDIGGFDEKDGIFYDMEYPVLCAMRGLPPVKAVPSTPHLHLHNQSTAYGDPAVGTWGHDLQSFVAKYGKEPGEVLAEHGYYGYSSVPIGTVCPEPNLRIWKYGGKFAAPGI